MKKYWYLHLDQNLNYHALSSEGETVPLGTEVKSAHEILQVIRKRETSRYRIKKVLLIATLVLLLSSLGYQIFYHIFLK